MDETGKQLLNLMFRDGEAVCVSPDKFGYHSIPLSTVLNEESVNLLLPNFKDEKDFKTVPTKDLLLVALNPIQGFRKDCNCKAYRNFLIEMDTGSLKDQIYYIRSLGIPYSAIVFSGGKSAHVLVSLDQDLPNEEQYRFVAQWMLNIITMADQNCKNPSRGIRIPGAYREPGKKQRLLELKGQVKLEDLMTWLKTRPMSEPKPKEKRVYDGEVDISRVPKWVFKLLESGHFPHGRNKTWFLLARSLAERGLDEDTIVRFFSKYFHEDRDFKEREWLTAIASGCKLAFDKK